MLGEIKKNQRLLNSGFWKFETLTIVFLAAGGNRLIICSIQFPLNDDNLFPRFFLQHLCFHIILTACGLPFCCGIPLTLFLLYLQPFAILFHRVLCTEIVSAQALRTATYLQLFLADPLKMCHMSTDDFSNCSGFSLWCLCVCCFFLPFAKTFGPNFEN